MSKRTLLGLLVLSLLFALLVPLTATGAAKQRATLRYGSKGSDVKIAQTKLKESGYYEGKVDGIYGWRTYDAILSFQEKHKLATDGIVGPRTWAAIEEWGGHRTGRAAKKAPGKAAKASPTPAHPDGHPPAHPHAPAHPRAHAPAHPHAPAPAPTRATPAAARAPARAPANRGNRNLRASDRDLLARMTFAEAESEPYEGQVAVAAVILNRIKDPKFPKNIQAVIFQTDAFEPVSNGRIYLSANDSARRAAADAMNGIDPSNGALYFWNPATATSPWIWSRKITKRIGKHVFGF
jgi:N-acetylmuramoyl-L-alanine amidase